MDAMRRDLKGGLDNVQGELGYLNGGVARMKAGVDRLCDRLSTKSSIISNPSKQNIIHFTKSKTTNPNPSSTKTNTPS